MLKELDSVVIYKAIMQIGILEMLNCASNSILFDKIKQKRNLREFSVSPSFNYILPVNYTNT